MKLHRMTSTITNLNWFPGHMNKTLRTLKETHIKKAHLILPIYDARTPLTSVNESLNSLIKDKKHINIYNKSDLANLTITTKILNKRKEPYIYTNSNNKKNIDKLYKHIKSIVKPRFKTTKYVITVVGMPNVGKSSIINSLRRFSIKGKSNAKTGKIAGVTKNLSTFDISLDPKIVVIDTPGILLPNIKNKDRAIKLALVLNIKDDILDPIYVAEYLLYAMNEINIYEYLKLLKLNKPIYDIYELLEIIRKKFNFKLKEYEKLSAKWLLSQYHKGLLGRFTLDDERINKIV